MHKKSQVVSPKVETDLWPPRWRRDARWLLRGAESARLRSERKPKTTRSRRGLQDLPTEGGSSAGAPSVRRFSTDSAGRLCPLSPTAQLGAPTWWPRAWVASRGSAVSARLPGPTSVCGPEGERLDPQPRAAPNSVSPQSILEREVVLPPGCADINPLANNKWINNNKV